MSETAEATRAALSEALFALAKLALRENLGVGDMKQLCDRAFVRAASCVEEDQVGRVPTITQIANRTGLSQPIVRKVLAINSGAVAAVARGESRITRVIRGWKTDGNYHDSAGVPRVLPLKGPISFTELVREYAKGGRIKSVLTELRRLKLVRLVEDDTSVELIGSESSGQLDAEGIRSLGQATRDLVEALVERLENPTAGSGKYFRYILNERMHPDKALIYGRDQARQLHSLANTVSKFNEAPDASVWPTDQPQKAGRVVCMLLLSQRPVVIPADPSRHSPTDRVRIGSNTELRGKPRPKGR